MNWQEILTSSLGAAVVLWFVSKVEVGFKRRKILKQLREETKYNIRVLKRIPGPRTRPFPVNSFILNNVLSKSMIDISVSEILFNILFEINDLYLQLEEIWKQLGPKISEAGLESKEAKACDDTVSHIIRSLIIPLTYRLIEIINIELSVFRNKKKARQEIAKQ